MPCYIYIYIFFYCFALSLTPARVKGQTLFKYLHRPNWIALHVFSKQYFIACSTPECIALLHCILRKCIANIQATSSHCNTRWLDSVNGSQSTESTGEGGCVDIPLQMLRIICRVRYKCKLRI